jgi:hypothetical protein
MIHGLAISESIDPDDRAAQQPPGNPPAKPNPDIPTPINPRPIKEPPPPIPTPPADEPPPPLQARG